MEITQIQVNYLETEDRILMRVNFGLDQHVALILTPRISRFLLENIAAMPLVQAEIVASKPAVAFAEHSEQTDVLHVVNAAAVVLNATCQRTDLEARFTFMFNALPQLNLNLSLLLARGLESLLKPLVEQAQWFVPLNDNRTTSAEKDQNDALMTTLPPSTLLH
jgi:hypothetical protein